MKILIFTEGTIIMHKNKKLIHDYSSYVPVGNAADKLNGWKKQGNEIIYLTSRTQEKEIDDVKSVFNKYNFPDGKLLFRKAKEQYKDIAEKVMPDILIEDNCESIGGADNMVIMNVKPEIKQKIKSICVKEFKGIDHLPDNILMLKTMPQLFKNKYRVESTRLKGWDYSHRGYYFVTICVKNCECYFGEIAEDKILLSEIGKIAEKFWLEIPKHFDNIYLDAYIIMPNHLHGIVKICNDDGRDEALPRLYNGDHPEMSKISPNAGSLSVIIGSYKSIVSKTIHQQFLKINFNWQSGFYDHIVRNEISLNKIRKYIIDNPFRWHLDKNNPEGLWM